LILQLTFDTIFKFETNLFLSQNSLITYYLSRAIFCIARTYENIRSIVYMNVYMLFS